MNLLGLVVAPSASGKYGPRLPFDVCAPLTSLRGIFNTTLDDSQCNALGVRLFGVHR